MTQKRADEVGGLLTSTNGLRAGGKLPPIWLTPWANSPQLARVVLAG